MAAKSSPATTAGIVTGILFMAAAMIPNSHAYPLVVPLLGGALAAFLAGRASPVGPGDGAKLGAKAGVVGGLILVLVGSPLMYLLVGPVIRERLEAGGINLPLGGFLALSAGLLIVALLGLLLAVIGGVVGALIFGRR